MDIESFACSATQTWNESCILDDVVGDSLTTYVLVWFNDDLNAYVWVWFNGDFFLTTNHFIHCCSMKLGEGLHD
jgi:hypothetical protein